MIAPRQNASSGHVWSFFGGIIIASITSAVAFLGQGLIAKNNLELEVLKQEKIIEASQNSLELERLKLDAEERKQRRGVFEKRCDDMAKLFSGMNLNYQTAYIDGSPENLDPTLTKWAALNAQTQTASTYFGSDAWKEFKKAAAEQEQKDVTDPLEKSIPFIRALRVELSLCNAAPPFSEKERVVKILTE